MDFEESVAIAKQAIKILGRENIGSEVLGEDLWAKFREAFQDA